MTRTKYAFKSRQLAEDAYHEENRRALRAEWLASALIQGRTKFVGRVDHTCVSYFHTRHSAFVHTYQRVPSSPHCIGRIYEIDEVPERIREIRKYVLAHDSFDWKLSELLEKAFGLATKEFEQQLVGN